MSPLPRLSIDANLDGDDAARKALERLHLTCELQQDALKRQGRLWKNIGRWLVLPSTGLAAASGVTGLADPDSRVIAAAIALGAAVLGALVATLKPFEVSAAYYSKGERIDVLQRNLGVLLYVDRGSTTEQDLRVALEKALTQFDEIHEIPPDSSFLWKLRSTSVSDSRPPS